MLLYRRRAGKDRIVLLDICSGVHTVPSKFIRKCIPLNKRAGERVSKTTIQVCIRVGIFQPWHGEQFHAKNESFQKPSHLPVGQNKSNGYEDDRKGYGQMQRYCFSILASHSTALTHLLFPPIQWHSILSCPPPWHWLRASMQESPRCWSWQGWKKRFQEVGLQLPFASILVTLCKFTEKGFSPHEHFRNTALQVWYF